MSQLPVPYKKITALLATLFNASVLGSSLLSQQALANDDNINLDTVNVVGVTPTPNANTSFSPTTILNGHALDMRRASTLGETLNSIPGISASGFGPNASRPTIHGLDGDRVNIMQNGIGIVDASSLSADHTVAIDPIISDKIEVIRGSEALRYGNNAAGGVINTIDNRIPTDAITGITGRAEATYGGANNQKNEALVLDTGNGLLAIHADAYDQKNDNLRIPSDAVSQQKALADGTLQTHQNTLENSAAHGYGGALGASLTFDKGYAGLSYANFNDNYGTVAEPNVHIHMKSSLWNFNTEAHDLSQSGFNMLDSVKLKLAYSDYQHQEIDGSTLGTTFKNNGVEGTIEAGHMPISGMQGVVGYQYKNTDFSALGDEAFVPSTNTLSNALYFYEKLPLIKVIEPLQLNFSGRIESVKVDSQGGGKFGTAQSKSFNPASIAADIAYTFNPSWSLTSSLSHNERAPNYAELYANGPHMATAQYIVGSINLNNEISNNIEAKLHWKDTNCSFELGAYYTHYDNYIGAFNTGKYYDPSGSETGDPADLAGAIYVAIPAVFKGLEAQGRYQINDQLSLAMRGDYTLATNSNNQSPLPYISPLRIGATMQYQQNKFSANLDFLHAFAQNKIGENELPTAGYTNVSLMASYQLPNNFSKTIHLELFAKANNLLNQEIRDASSLLKDISPAGARAILIGLKGNF